MKDSAFKDQFLFISICDLRLCLPPLTADMEA